MKNCFKLSLVLFISLLSYKANSQATTMPSDDQLNQIIIQAEQRGMSPAELQALAKSKGYSDAQISALMMKANGLGGNKANANTLGNIKQAGTLSQAQNNTNQTSQKDSVSLTDEEKKIFGFEVFANKTMSFAPNLSMATPRNYVVGPGDDLIVQIYGIAQATINLKVSNEGKVVIPNVGLSHVGGLTIEAVKSLLTQKIGTRYAGLGGANPSSYLQITLANVRTIKVNIVGDVKTPGTFQLPSYTTAFNALYSAGGPTTKGSFRNIQLFRAGRLVTEVDLYDFLLKGKTDHNVRLEDGDVLLVPKYVNRVEIIGEVRRPLYFETKAKENVNDLIQMANGFKETAFKDHVTIQRYTGVDKIILHVESANFSKTSLEDGDAVSVSKALTTFQNRVQLIGAVVRPGDYESNKTERIADVLKKAGGLKPDAFLGRAILYRSSADLSQQALDIDLKKVVAGDLEHNILVQKEDVLVIASNFDMKEIYSVSIDGEVNQKGAFPYAAGMTIGDLIIKAKGLKQSASSSYIEVVRRVKDSPTELAKVIKAEINSDLSINEIEKKIALEPFDQVFVRPSIGYKEFKYIYVQGEASYTGKYVFDKFDLKVGDLLYRAGGVLPSANLKGALLIRKSLFFKPKRNIDEYLNRLKELNQRNQETTNSGMSESNRILASQIKTQITNIEKQNKLDSLSKLENNEEIDLGDIENIKSSIQKSVLKNLKDVSISESEYQFVSIDLDEILKSPGGSADLQLSEGDILYIPTFDETVSISGDVLYPVSVKFNQSASLKYFVDQAGGFNNTALRKRSYVVAANGSVLRTKSFMGIRIYPRVSPGSHVFVPKDMKPKGNFSIDRLLGLTSSLVTTYLLIFNLTK
ncbi:polysaccharide biosynthesis/export family protein [Aquirufa sp. A-Brett2-W8]